MGSLTGLCTPIAREERDKENQDDSEQDLLKVFSRQQGWFKTQEEKHSGEDKNTKASDQVGWVQSSFIVVGELRASSSRRPVCSSGNRGATSRPCTHPANNYNRHSESQNAAWNRGDAVKVKPFSGLK